MNCRRVCECHRLSQKAIHRSSTYRALANTEKTVVLDSRTRRRAICWIAVTALLLGADALAQTTSLPPPPQEAAPESHPPTKATSADAKKTDAKKKKKKTKKKGASGDSETSEKASETRKEGQAAKASLLEPGPRDQNRLQGPARNRDPVGDAGPGPRRHAGRLAGPADRGRRDRVQARQLRDLTRAERRLRSGTRPQRQDARGKTPTSTCA